MSDKKPQSDKPQKTYKDYLKRAIDLDPAYKSYVKRHEIEERFARKKDEKS